MSAAAAPLREISFDEERHEYLVNGRKLPGITGILKARGEIDDIWFRVEHARRGSAVHLLTQLCDEGDLDPRSVDERLLPYASAWKDFLADTKAEMAEVPELLVAAPSLNYATRIDRVLRMTLPSGLVRTTTINIKSGAEMKSHRLQTAGEVVAYSEWRGVRLSSLDRATVQLSPDGRYKLHRHEDRHDITIWTGIVQRYYWS